MWLSVTRLGDFKNLWQLFLSNCIHFAQLLKRGQIYYSCENCLGNFWDIGLGDFLLKAIFHGINLCERVCCCHLLCCSIWSQNLEYGKISSRDYWFTHLPASTHLTHGSSLSMEIFFLRYEKITKPLKPVFQRHSTISIPHHQSWQRC